MASPVAFTVKTPSVAVPVMFVTPEPPMIGLLFTEVKATTTPEAETKAPPSLVILPPSVALPPVMLAEVGVVMVGADTVPLRRKLVRPVCDTVAGT